MLGFIIFISACMLSRFSHVQLFVTLWTAACQAALSRGFSRQEYWSGLPCPPPGIFLTQGSNPCLLCLLHWQASPLPPAPLGKPIIFSTAPPGLSWHLVYLRHNIIFPDIIQRPSLFYLHAHNRLLQNPKITLEYCFTLGFSDGNPGKF